MGQEVFGKIWDGSVHVRIVLNNTEFEYLLDAKRVLYFPVYFQRIVEFLHAATGNPDLLTHAVWLEYESVPLKWNLPIGLLYDILCLPKTKIFPARPPWTLTMKVDGAGTPYPADHIIPFTGANSSSYLLASNTISKESRVNYMETLDRILINSLKQSCYVSNGNSRSVLSLSQDDTKSLWKAISNHDMSVYTSISRKLSVPSRSVRQRIPMKLFVAGSVAIIQAPVWSQSESGSDTTLSMAISEQWKNVSQESKLPQVFIQGINVDVILHESLIDIWYQFRYLDNFLYVVLVPVSPVSGS